MPKGGFYTWERRHCQRYLQKVTVFMRAKIDDVFITLQVFARQKLNSAREYEFYRGNSMTGGCW